MGFSIAKPWSRAKRPAADLADGEVARLATLKETALAAGRARSAESFLDHVIGQLGRLVGSKQAAIMLLEGDRLHAVVATGLPAEVVESLATLPLGPRSGTCGTAIETEQSSICETVQSDKRFLALRDPLLAAGLRACWSVPLTLPDRTVMGTLVNYRTRRGAPTAEQLELSEAYASIVALGLDNVRRQADLAESYESAILALTSALDVRDDYTGAHSNETSRLVREVGSRLGLTGAELDAVAQVAALHDVGKLGVPTEILTSPTPLTPEQNRVMREHPAIGEQILRQIPGMDTVANAVRHEHERWDGGGYPDGLVGEEIPLASRIVFACDAYHAMISDRPYRTGLDHAAAIAELKSNAGTQFDPAVIAALLEILGDDGAGFGHQADEADDVARRHALERIAHQAGAGDVFVFRKVARDTYSHLAGAGMGAGWAGNIELRTGESQLAPVVEAGRLLRLNSEEPARIVGPYYARSAAIVPCRYDVIVVFGSGSDSVARVSERELTLLAERAAQLVDQVAPAKRLADELEVLDAVRAVTTVNAPTVEATLEKIAERAAIALSCEFAAVIVDRDVVVPRAGWIDRGWHPGRSPVQTRELVGGLAAGFRLGKDRPILIQDTAGPRLAPRGFRFSDNAASLHVVPIDDLGVLVAVHARPNPRGFTSLCQRVARSLAEGAELVVRRALAQEQLSHENKNLGRRARTDPLTGVRNRGEWDHSIYEAQLELSHGGAPHAVAVFDLDGLKAVNDREGHAAGDELLRAFALILARTARAHDFVARIGGDEFAALLRDCDERGAASWCRRVADGVAAHNAAEPRRPIEFSYGLAAAASGGSLAAAVATADRALYRNKGADERQGPPSAEDDVSRPPRSATKRAAPRNAS